MRPVLNPQMALGQVRADDYKKARKRILGKRGIVCSGIDPEDLVALQSNNTNPLPNVSIESSRNTSSTTTNTSCSQTSLNSTTK